MEVKAFRIGGGVITLAHDVGWDVEQGCVSPKELAKLRGFPRCTLPWLGFVPDDVDDGAGGGAAVGGQARYRSRGAGRARRAGTDPHRSPARSTDISTVPACATWTRSRFRRCTATSTWPGTGTRSGAAPNTRWWAGRTPIPGEYPTTSGRSAGSRGQLLARSCRAFPRTPGSA